MHSNASDMPEYIAANHILKVFSVLLSYGPECLQVTQTESHLRRFLVLRTWERYTGKTGKYAWWMFQDWFVSWPKITLLTFHFDIHTFFILKRLWTFPYKTLVFCLHHAGKQILIISRCFSIWNIGVLSLHHAGKQILITSHCFLKGQDLPTDLLKDLGKFIFLLFFHRWDLIPSGTDMLHVQISGQNQSLSFSIHVQFCQLPNWQSPIISYYFNHSSTF
jgi:hypothetical protein